MFGAQLEAQRLEKVASNPAVDHDAADDGDLCGPIPHVRRLLDAVVEEVPHDRVHLVRDIRDRIPSLLDARNERFEAVDDDAKLGVELIVIIWIRGRQQRRIRVGLLRLGLDRNVRAHSRTAGLRYLGLALSLQTAYPAVRIDANVRCEEDEQFAVVRHVVKIRTEAGPARERQPAQAAQRESLFPSRHHQIHELLCVLVHLVRAHAVGEERVGGGEAAPVEGARHLGVEITREDRSGEVFVLCRLRLGVHVEATECPLRPSVFI